MTDGVHALVAMCAAIGARNRGALAAAIDAAAIHAQPAEAEEALLQSYLFVGYPLALQAFAMWRERTGNAAVPAARTDDMADNPHEWRARGEAVCEQVYAGQYGRLRENIAQLHPDMERWMLEEGYGKVLGRSGLDLKVRELCIVGVLVGLDAPQQLYSHVRGALNAGATEADVESAIEIACGQAGLAARESAKRVWQDVKARKAGSRNNTDMD